MTQSFILIGQKNHTNQQSVHKNKNSTQDYNGINDDISKKTSQKPKTEQVPSNKQSRKIPAGARCIAYDMEDFFGNALGCIVNLPRNPIRVLKMLLHRLLMNHWIVISSTAPTQNSRAN